MPSHHHCRAAGPYRVAVVDVPWPYEVDDDDPSHRGVWPYTTMSIEQICALDVMSIMHKDAILWMWTTNFHMRVAFKVLDAWGFTDTPTILNVGEESRMGNGHWLSGKTEHCVLAVRGKPIVTLTNQCTLLQAPVRGHSAKPREFYDLVEVFVRPRGTPTFSHATGTTTAGTSTAAMSRSRQTFQFQIFSIAGQHDQSNTKNFLPVAGRHGSPNFAIKLALRKYPNLAPAGFDGKKSEFDHQQIETALAFLEMCGSAPFPTYGSYTLKHVAEDWGAIFSHTTYVANGCIIAAAAALGLVVQRYPEPGSPNAGIGVDRTKTQKIMRALHWCVGAVT